MYTFFACDERERERKRKRERGGLVLNIPTIRRNRTNLHAMVDLHSNRY